MSSNLQKLTRRVHLVGISGAGMLPLGICLKQANFVVSGEDENLSEEAKSFLDEYGIEVQATSTLTDSSLVLTLIGSSLSSLAYAVARRVSVTAGKGKKIDWSCGIAWEDQHLRHADRFV
jgi:UDP-N-acetylmuramate-alanine ligase